MTNFVSWPVGDCEVLTRVFGATRRVLGKGGMVRVRMNHH